MIRRWFDDDSTMIRQWSQCSCQMPDFCHSSVDRLSPGTMIPRCHGIKWGHMPRMTWHKKNCLQRRWHSDFRDHFFSLLDEFFRGDKEKDALAVLKRSIVVMFGSHALYLRLPSERRDAIVHRICLEDVHLDLLGDRDKPLYGKYKGGTMETGPNFD